MRTVNILGCCVSRDIFDEKCIQNPAVYEDLYQVLQYVGLASPMSLYQPPPENKIRVEDIADFVGPNFRKRCMVLDHNNACFDYIRQKQSDYLVMDIADARLSIAQYQQTRFISCAILYAQNRQRLAARFGKPVIHRFNDWDMETWEACMDWYCDQILKLYPPEKIILLEVLRADEYLDKAGGMRRFSEADIRRNHAMNALLERFFHVCAERFAGCHIVRMPEGAFSDASHKLGLLPLHYHCLYYEYAFRALRMITQEQPDAEAEKLETLRGDYSTRFALLRDKLAEMETPQPRRVFQKGAAMEHYDVGIYGLWYGHNYGSMITYYALSEVVRAMGYSYAMIKNPLGANVDPNTLRRSHVLRFAAEHYPITPLCRLDEMAKHNAMFDKFLLGSDQMWNYGLSRPYRQSYFLDFAEDGKAKLAYATSFGRENYNGPPEAIPETRKNLARFDAISVRDAFSKRILREDFGLDSSVVMDPVFLCPPERYGALITEAGNFGPDEDYIFAYILDPNPIIGENLEKIAAESGLRVLVALNESGDKDALIALLRLKGDRVTCLREPTIQEWLFLVKNARFILTDSFHGTCFSLIYRRPFITLKNQRRGPERFPNLLRIFHLETRIIDRPEDFFEKFRQSGLDLALDYEKAWQCGQKEIDFSWNWLEKALSGSGAPLKRSAANLDKAVTEAVSAENCTGCGACVGVCPKNALSLKPDAHGYYRRAVNAALCVNCGKCTAICPALKLPENRNAAKPGCFAFQAADTALLYASSSGGAFGVLAKEAFRRGGSVAGVAWSGDLRDPDAPPEDWKDDFRAVNALIDRPEGLYKLRRSKYMQSYTGNICRQVKEKLDAGTFVLFEGTPCQTAGLRAYLGKDYENLLIVDILCGNAPSQLFFQKYLSGAFPDGIESYQFRYKVENRAWNCITVMVTDRNAEKEIRQGEKQDDYQRLYHPHVMCPKHCEQCRYQRLPRFGDLTIGDFWGIGKRDPQIDTQKGVSVILCNNEKGRAFLDSLPKSEIGLMKKVPLNWIGGNGSALPGRHNWAAPSRDQFYENILRMPFREAADRALKPDYAYLETLPAPESKPALRFDTHFLHFRFHPDIWEEAYVRGNLTLFARPEQPGTGNYASMPLYRCLRKGQTYALKMRFQARTDSDVINFHVKDSGSTLYQVIHSHKLPADQKGRWQTVEISFRPDSDLYDEFMIGAAQIRGPERYIAFQYVYISEKEEA